MTVAIEQRDIKVKNLSSCFPIWFPDPDSTQHITEHNNHKLPDQTQECELHKQTFEYIQLSHLLTDLTMNLRDARAASNNNEASKQV
jgi:hypothetical protein